MNRNMGTVIKNEEKLTLSSLLLEKSATKGVRKPAALESHKHKEKKKSGQIPQTPQSPEPTVDRPSNQPLSRGWEREREKEREREGGGNLNPKQMASIGAEHEKH